MYAIRSYYASRGERLRRALEKLGPVFVKFGQMLSTRRDLLPPDLADEAKDVEAQLVAQQKELARAQELAQLLEARQGAQQALAELEGGLSILDAAAREA